MNSPCTPLNGTLEYACTHAVTTYIIMMQVCWQGGTLSCCLPWKESSTNKTFTTSSSSWFLTAHCNYLWLLNIAPCTSTSSTFSHSLQASSSNHTLLYWVQCISKQGSTTKKQVSNDCIFFHLSMLAFSILYTVLNFSTCSFSSDAWLETSSNHLYFLVCSCPELEADVRVESALEHKRTKQLVKVKMTSKEKILKSLKRRLLDLSKRSAATQQEDTSGFENTRTMRRVSTHVSAQQVYPTSLPGSPVLDRWCWHETSEGSEMEHAIPSRFAARNTPVDHWREKKDSSRFSRRVASLTGGSSSLPGSPVLKLKSSKTKMQHKGVAIPQRFLDHYESLHTESSQLSTSHVPKRFITET